jgi:hypothetical protein
MRDFAVCVPADCIVSLDSNSNQAALDHMKTTLKADISPSIDIRFKKEPA